METVLDIYIYIYIYISRLLSASLESSSRASRASDRIDRVRRGVPFLRRARTRPKLARELPISPLTTRDISIDDLSLARIVTDTFPLAADTFWTATKLPRQLSSFQLASKSGQTIAYADETVRKRLGTHDLVPRGHDTPCVCVCVKTRDGSTLRLNKNFSLFLLFAFFFPISTLRSTLSRER